MKITAYPRKRDGERRHPGCSVSSWPLSAVLPAWRPTAARHPIGHLVPSEKSNTLFLPDALVTTRRILATQRPPGYLIPHGRSSPSVLFDLLLAAQRPPRTSRPLGVTWSLG